MHFDDLRGVPNGDARVGCTKTAALARQHHLVADENDLDIEFFGRLHGALDTGCGTMVPPHRIKCDLHAGLCARDWNR